MAAQTGHRALGSALIPNPYSGSYDAFMRLRTCNPETLFYSNLTYGLDAVPDVYESAATGNASFSDESSGVRLSTTTSGDVGVLQSISYHRYQPGKSQYIKQTCVFGDPQTDVTKRFGYFDAANGIFLEQDGSGNYYIVKRNGGVDTRVQQSEWNFDTMDDLDLSKALILLIDIEWLGVGSVRVAFVAGGYIRIAHIFDHAGIVTAPYMETATLPVAWEIRQGGSTAGSMLAICAAVDSEGGANEELGHPFSISNQGTGIACAAGADTPVLAIRPALTLNGKENRVGIVMQEVSIYIAGNPALVHVSMHDIVTGGSWLPVNGHSAIEYNVTATGATGGHDVSCQYIPSSGTGSNARGGSNLGINQSIPISLNIDGTSQAYGACVKARGIGGTSTVYAAISWKELH